MPILELRGGLIAATLLGLKGIPSFIICFIGNIIPIPLILWFITPIFDKMKKTKMFSGLVEKLEKKAMSKKEQIEKRKPGRPKGSKNKPKKDTKKLQKK